ncbi:LacI family DNA-binding transcriptional regulator [Phycicoccus sp. BSK3Z-2]|uniref:LacI family DNA-binding transcriptional regulator n=1 Tax=Phycicoccus avicenniae TaxID=2828860 RepID=A0A941D5X6_9MICO|nr:LacI family DNA-binding transcriptional regulator [Phycicoccus avicenniae]MBR7742046.1 LacI family DNA-binding transcriptional regulator [Phycicoccus avicenniae]
MADRERPRAPTLSDVARAAGVSVPTVSRVLNSTVPVSEAKRTLVEQAVRDLGYRPNPAAQSLVRGTRSLVAVVASDTTRFGYAMTIQGIEEEARKAGIAVAISVVETADPDVIERATDLLLGQALTGVIVIEFDEAGQAALRALPPHVPVVATAPVARRDGVTRVLLDDETPGREATEYLLGLGHRTVHHVAIPVVGRPIGRVVGWRAALEAAGAPVPEVEQADWTPLSGYEAGRRLASRPEVTAVLCGNDELAMGVLRAMAEAGRRVPEDVSVMGFDDLAVSAFTLPPLSTVAQDFHELGRLAFRALGEVADGRPVRRGRRVRAELVIRDSTGPAPTPVA